MASTGWSVDMDEENTSITQVAGSGAPWAIARAAAVEEVVGVMGDIDEGDVGGRVEDDAGIYAKLDILRDSLAAAEDPTLADMTPGQRLAVEALVGDGEDEGFFDLHTDDAALLLQKWISGEAEPLAVLEAAEGLGHEKLSAALKKQGYVLEPASRSGP